jgi:hypothetical protein
MKHLLHYFRAKPIRLLYAIIWLALTSALLWKTGYLLYEAEIFAKVVQDPDHRMQPDKFKGLNSDRIRSEREANDFPESAFNIVFLGDSFIYGFLLPQENMAPPAQLESILRKQYGRQDINVANFGWTSSSPYLSLRLLQDIGEKYHPDLILLALDMSDYRDEWFYKSVLNRRGFYNFVVDYPRTAFVIKKGTEIVSPIKDLHSQLFGYSGNGGYFVARQPMAISQNLFDDVYESLWQLQTAAQSMHAPLIVFIPPRHWQYTDRESPESWENGSFDALGPYALENFRYFEGKTPPFPIIPLLEDFKQAKEFPLHFKVDSHWNKHGARFFAERVAVHLQEHGLLTPLDSAEKISPSIQTE